MVFADKLRVAVFYKVCGVGFPAGTYCTGFWILDTVLVLFVAYVR